MNRGPHPHSVSGLEMDVTTAYVVPDSFDSLLVSNQSDKKADLFCPLSDHMGAVVFVANRLMGSIESSTVVTFLPCTR